MSCVDDDELAYWASLRVAALDKEANAMKEQLQQLLQRLARAERADVEKPELVREVRAHV